MSVTRQAPSDGGASRRDGPPGQEDELEMGFGESMRLLYADAKAQNDARMVAWYEELFKSLSKDEPDAYAVKFKREFMEQARRSFDENVERSLDRRMRRNIERQTEKQIMVDNFRVFRREYVDMMIRRSC